MWRPSRETQAQKADLDSALHSSGLLGCYYSDEPGGRAGVLVSAQSGGDKRSPNLDRDTDGHNHINSYAHSHSNSDCYAYIHLYIHPYAHSYIYTYTDADIYIYAYIHPYAHPYVHIHVHLYPAAYHNPRADPDHLHRDTGRYPLLDS
jgi:hypothetical protein